MPVVRLKCNPCTVPSLSMLPHGHSLEGQILNVCLGSSASDKHLCLRKQVKTGGREGEVTLPQPPGGEGGLHK